MERTVYTRACTTRGCRQRGREYTQVVPGSAPTHPHMWPVCGCVDCGHAMPVTQVADLDQRSEVAQALDALERA